MFDPAVFAAAYAALVDRPAALTAAAVRALVLPAEEYYHGLHVAAGLTPPGYVDGYMFMTRFPDEYGVRLSAVELFDTVWLAFLTHLALGRSRFVVCRHTMTRGGNRRQYDVRPVVCLDSGADDDPTDHAARAAVNALPELFVKLDLHLVRTSL